MEKVREKLIWRIWAEIWRNYGHLKRMRVGKGTFEKKKEEFKGERSRSRMKEEERDGNFR